MYDNDYPLWVCHSCGLAHSKLGVVTGTSTWHSAICGVCLKEKPVTSPRDYGYPKFPKDTTHGTPT